MPHMRPTTFILLALALAGCRNPSAPNAPTPYDLVIRNGQILDGSGSPAIAADIGIRAGRIVAIGKLPAGAGNSQLDAHGLTVAPGFIDVHTHADEDVHTQPYAENFIRDGVTTIVTGNCGGSVRDVAEYFRRIQGKGCAVNVARLIGHNTGLKAGEGDRAGELTPAQMQQAKDIVRQAMLDGAVGLSTGLIYPPGQFSTTEEIIELQKVAASFGGIYASHMRSEGSNILLAIAEALRIWREANCLV